MRPGAHVAAAIEIVDDMLEGRAAEQALTRWARNSRFAGSKDRAAIRDLVFDHLRTWRSDAFWGGIGVKGASDTGRARMIGRLRASNTDLAAVFDGVGHAPAPLSAAEADRKVDPSQMTQGVRWNLPDWLVPMWSDMLGEVAEEQALALQARAPVTLRVNTQAVTVASAMEALTAEGIEVAANLQSATALSVLSNPRRVRQSQAFAQGWVELQDASSQQAVAEVPEGNVVLDYCAGGGGKALALAAQGRRVYAHDINPLRMVDLPVRAERAGVEIAQVATDEIADAGPFEVVFCDAPCSGSGAWRRNPEGKWTLTSERLQTLMQKQDQVLSEAARHVRPGGALVFATCSVLRCENEERVHKFLNENKNWTCDTAQNTPISELGDGFFFAQLRRKV